MKTYKIAELLGDGISTELSESIHAVASVLPVKLQLTPVDLSLDNRRRSGAKAYDVALEAMRSSAASLKYPTTTETESPNKILRERCNFSVIHRPCATIAGVPTNFTKPIDVDIVRVATGGTYDDAGRRIGLHSAVSVRVIEKQPCLHAARYAYRLAAQRNRTVISASKYTIQQATDGLFEEAVDEIAAQHPSIKHQRVLFDALLAKIALKPEDVQVVVCPNEYGDFLSDCAAGLIGSLGLADSASYSFRDDGSIALAMFDPAGGTAPDIAGQDVVNPTAAFFALCTMLTYLGEQQTGERLKAAIMTCLGRRQTTRDLGGKLGTRAFTAAVADAFRELSQA